MRLYEKQDDQGSSLGTRKAGKAKWFRQKKHRVERRRAKNDPECTPAYNRYRGWVLLIPVCLLVACQTKRQFTLPNGAGYSDNGHLAGDTLVMMKPDGTVILRNKMNEPWGKTMDTALGGIMGVQAGLTQRAFNAGEAAVATADIGTRVPLAEVATKVPLAEIATKVPLAEVAEGAPAAAVRASKKLRLFKSRLILLAGK